MSGQTEDLDAPEARLDMVRAALRMIIDGCGDPVALAKAGLDFCDRTQAEREAMRGEA